MREVVSAGMVVVVAALIAAWLSVESRAQTRPSLTGAWTLNKDLSDQPPDRGDQNADGGRRRGGGGGGGGGFGGGGFGGRHMGGRGGGYGGGAQMDPEAMARMREAMRAVTQPSERLTITEADKMIVITTAEGRTMRLATDGSKVKDENTKIERKTKWDGDKLVSEISGIGPGKITQTYTVDPEHHQLRITTNIERGQGGQPRVISHVYDAGT
jgi:hypothetical protein